MSLVDGKNNAYGDEVLSKDNFVGVTSTELARELLSAKLQNAKRGVWLDLHGSDDCGMLLPAALRAGMAIHSGSGDSVTLRAWGASRTDKDPCPERAFCIHIVHCLVVRADGAVLMVKQSYDTSQRFTLPGGFIDAGESVEDAAVRETHEETGVWARFKGMLHTAHAPSFVRPTRFGHSAIVHTPIMRIADESLDAPLGETNTAEEISDVQWVPCADWSSSAWGEAHCHHLVRFALQQLAMLSPPHAISLAGGGPPSQVCTTALAAIQAAATGQTTSGEAAAASDASQPPPFPKGYAGLCVEWDTQKNDGKMQVYCNDLSGEGGVEVWWHELQQDLP